MIDVTISEFVKGDNTVLFAYFRQGVFYYSVESKKTNNFYHFPVPIEDIGTATLNAYDKAITFMRWIRKAIDEKTLVKYFPQ